MCLPLHPSYMHWSLGHSLSRTFGALLCHFLFIMATICHLRAALSNPGESQTAPLRVCGSDVVSNS